LTAPAITPYKIDTACEIRLFHGPVESQFVAFSLQNGAVPRALAVSPWFRPPNAGALSSVPEIVTAHDQLLRSLAKRGWVRCGRGNEWYSDKLERAVVL
jgi:hypothetical protein